MVRRYLHRTFRSTKPLPEEVAKRNKNIKTSKNYAEDDAIKDVAYKTVERLNLLKVPQRQSLYWGPRGGGDGRRAVATRGVGTGAGPLRA